MEKSFFFIFVLKSAGMRLYYLNHGTIAQWLEQVTHNHLVAGSNPAGPTIFQSLFFRITRIFECKLPVILIPDAFFYRKTAFLCFSFCFEPELLRKFP